MESGDLFAELFRGPGSRESELPDVGVEVEGRVVDPVRPTWSERHLHEALAEDRPQVQPCGEKGAHRADVPRVDVGRARVHIKRPAT